MPRDGRYLTDAGILTDCASIAITIRIYLFGRKGNERRQTTHSPALKALQPHNCRSSERS